MSTERLLRAPFESGSLAKLLLAYGPLPAGSKLDVMRTEGAAHITSASIPTLLIRALYEPLWRKYDFVLPIHKPAECNCNEVKDPSIHDYPSDPMPADRSHFAHRLPA